LAKDGTTIIMRIPLLPVTEWSGVVRDRHELVWDLGAQRLWSRYAD
jgi:hypothetical protein